MNRISYSQLTMYGDCPLRWKLNYIDKLSVSESNIYLIFGTAMHITLQKYLDVMYNITAKKADELDLNKMLQDNLVEEFNIAKENGGKFPCTKEEIQEFYEDGVEILDFFKKRRNEYFRKNNYELIGCEVPVNMSLQKNLRWIGFLDIVLKNNNTGEIKIYDIKTSTKGWNKWAKKDENKTQQLLLYKQFYSKQYNTPIDKIEVEYFIVKRKLYENLDFPQKRIQKFSPASGTISMNKVAKRLSKFVDEAFNDDGSYSNKEFEPTPSKKSCRFCEFFDTKYCNKGIR